MPTNNSTELDSRALDVQFDRARQRLVKRNWRFSLVPSLVLIALLLILGWEILRQNVHDSAEWPWTITILGIAPAATLSGVFASLILAREQFARSMRPNLSWSSHFRPKSSLGSPAWTAQLMNFGPGIAHVEQVRYTVRAGGDTFAIVRERVTRADAIAALRACGLEEGRDFHLKLVTPGAPLPVVKQASEGMEFAGFSDEMRPMLQAFDFHLTVVDIMGDTHAKSLPFMATLPSKVPPQNGDRVLEAEGENP